MVNFPVNATNLRFLLPEVIWLEPEYFEQASEISNKVTGEAHQWQTYLRSRFQRDVTAIECGNYG